MLFKLDLNKEFQDYCDLISFRMLGLNSQFGTIFGTALIFFL